MKLINVGYIAGFHGLKGEMKVKATTDFVEDRFKVNSELLLIYKNEEIKVVITSHRTHKGMELIKIKDYSTLNDIEKFKGSALKIREDMLYNLNTDEYYFFELVGLNVFDYQNNKLGVVKKIVETGANEVIVVDMNGKDILVPFVKSFVNKVDITNKNITLFEVDGLW